MEYRLAAFRVIADAGGTIGGAEQRRRAQRQAANSAGFAPSPMADQAVGAAGTLTRVVVVGTSCSGKTTFARRLADILGAPCVELDSLYYSAGWTLRPEFQQEVAAAVQQTRWVIDGNYSRVRDILWRRCTAIVWLDYSFARVFSRAIQRTIRRIASGEQLYGGNRETLRSALFDLDAPLWLVVRSHGKRRREFPECFRRSEYRHATVIRLRTPGAAEEFLSETDDSSHRESLEPPGRAGEEAQRADSDAL